MTAAQYAALEKAFQMANLTPTLSINTPHQNSARALYARRAAALRAARGLSGDISALDKFTSIFTTITPVITKAADTASTIVQAKYAYNANQSAGSIPFYSTGGISPYGQTQGGQLVVSQPAASASATNATNYTPLLIGGGVLAVVAVAMLAAKGRK